MVAQAGSSEVQFKDGQLRGATAAAQIGDKAALDFISKYLFDGRAASRLHSASLIAVPSQLLTKPSIEASRIMIAAPALPDQNGYRCRMRTITPIRNSLL